jgi:rfaE bifunctional protein kinase chain/domain
MNKTIRVDNFCKEARIAVVGDVMLDRYMMGDVERISPEAPLPIVDVSSILNIPGGAANVMSNLASLGAKVWGFGATGNDKEGELVKDDLLHKQINVENILVDTRRPTTLKCRVMVGHHQMLRYDIESRDEVPDEVASGIINGLNDIARNVDMIVISDYDKGLMSRPLVTSILQIAKNNNIEVLVDPKVTGIRNYSAVEYLKINLSNAKKVIGMEYANQANGPDGVCRNLASILQCSNIIITMGKDGLLVLSNGNISHIPALAKDVYDVTGAGDVMTAVLSMALVNGYDILTACEIGTIAASIKVSKIGTYSVSSRELINEINMHNDKVLSL